MIKEQLYKDLFDKITDNSEVVIFGAYITGEKIFNDLRKVKPQIKVLGFIDNRVQGTFQGLPVWSLKEFVEKKFKDVVVIMSTTNDQNITINILDLYDIPVIKQTKFVSDYYRKDVKIFNDEDINEVVKIFDNPKDKELFQNIIKARLKILDENFYEEYYYNNIATEYGTNRVFRKQYLEKINKDAVKTVFDCGMFDGVNVIAYNKLLPNLEKTYGFEAIYDVTRNPYIENFIPMSKLEIVPFALGDCEKEINFFINKSFAWCSFGEEITNKDLLDNPDDWESRKVSVTTIDDFCKTKNVTPDLIKMDIEGAELSALKGGINTIKKYRPQLAISIYHQEGRDLISIPIYLSESLTDYSYYLEHYAPTKSETVLYAVPNELC